MQVIQIFGVKGSAATRAAERFFKERGAKLQIVDLKQKPMAPGEIRRFIEKFGLTALLDTDSNEYANAGLKYLKLSEKELLQKIEAEPKLVKLPLVRSGKLVAMGHDEESWKAIHAAAKI